KALPRQVQLAGVTVELLALLLVRGAEVLPHARTVVAGADGDLVAKGRRHVEREEPASQRLGLLAELLVDAAAVARLVEEDARAVGLVGEDRQAVEAVEDLYAAQRIALRPRQRG